MSSEFHTTPEPSGAPTYTEPLAEWIGTPVTFDWAGREVEGVVSDVEIEHEDHHFEGVLKVATGAATITVSPGSVIDPPIPPRE